MHRVSVFFFVDVLAKYSGIKWGLSTLLTRIPVVLAFFKGLQSQL